jgi:hypothetical protein
MTMNEMIDKARSYLAMKRMMKMVGAALLIGLVLGGGIVGLLLPHSGHDQADLNEIANLKANQSQLLSDKHNDSIVIKALQDANTQMAPDAQAYRESGLGKVSAVADSSINSVKQTAGSAWNGLTQPLENASEKANNFLDKVNSTAANVNQAVQILGSIGK